MFSRREVVKSFKVKLKFLRGFFWFTWTCCIKFHGLEDLFARVRVLLDQAACIFYWCYVGKLTPNVEYDMIRTITCYLTQMKPYEVEVREMYLKSLEGFTVAIFGYSFSTHQRACSIHYRFSSRQLHGAS